MDLLFDGEEDEITSIRSSLKERREAYDKTRERSGNVAGVDEKHCALIWEELARVAEHALVIVISHDQAVMEDWGKTGGRLLFL